MSSYSVTVRWERGPQLFTDNKYSRAHVWKFDSDIEVPASSSPHVVPMPFSNPDAVDPEEAFVAALSSCHMLVFLNIAARRGFTVDTYTDLATGSMGKNAKGKLAITEVELKPVVVFSGPLAPGPDELERLHHQAHDECFIANSVTTSVTCATKRTRAGAGK